MKSLLVVLAMVIVTYVSHVAKSSLPATTQVSCVPCDRH
jgi:hypothetical protein